MSILEVHRAPAHSVRVTETKRLRCLATYLRLVSSRIVSPSEEGPFEWHHILPKSLFPELSQTSKNYVKLTLREHYVVHRLLAYVHDLQGPMIRAYICMSDNGTRTSRATASERMAYSDEISRQMTERNHQWVEEGRHPWQRRSDGTSPAGDLVSSGKFHLLRRPDGTSVASDRVLAGTNPFQTRSDGTSVSGDKVSSGTHHWQLTPPWFHGRSCESSRLTWSLLSEIVDLAVENPTLSGHSIRKKFLPETNARSIRNIVEWYESGKLEEILPEWRAWKASGFPASPT